MEYMAPKKPDCPICGKPQEAEYKPFCSKRCSDVDLGRWLGEHYRIPTEEPPGMADWPGEDWEN